jgi:hypothetical protein
MPVFRKLLFLTIIAGLPKAELVRSPEYFCHSGLTQHIPKFGAEARQHLDELRVLKVEVGNDQMVLR